MPRATLNDPLVGPIEIHHQLDGDPDGPPLLLVAGLGAQLTSHREELVDALVARGLRVIRYDNRDVGLSTHLDALGPADLARAAARPSSVAYTLRDMARDAAGLLEALGIPAAHVAGISMGGMIAQQLAIDHPQRVKSLTSVMSTPHAAIAPPTPEAAAVLTPPPVTDADAAAEQAVRSAAITGSPAYPTPEGVIRCRARAAHRRAHNPRGVGRQLAAILASPDRRTALGAVQAPTLVIHGDADPLIPLLGGRETAAAVPGARLEIIPGMGHDLPDQLVDRLASLLADHVEAVDAVDASGLARRGGGS